MHHQRQNMSDRSLDRRAAPWPRPIPRRHRELIVMALENRRQADLIDPTREAACRRSINDAGDAQSSRPWKGIAMRNTFLALAAAGSLAVSADSLADAGPRTYPGAGGYPYWSGYVDAPVGEPTSPCYWRSERFWDGYAWHVRRVRICG
jgi:hypothetical protein